MFMGLLALENSPHRRNLPGQLAYPPTKNQVPRQNHAKFQPNRPSERNERKLKPVYKRVVEKIDTKGVSRQVVENRAPLGELPKGAKKTQANAGAPGRKGRAVNQPAE